MSAKLAKLKFATQRLRRLASRMEMQDLETLLIIALSPGVSPVDIQNQVGISNSAASRSAYRLSAEAEPGKPGLGLVAVEIDPHDRRRKQLYLTPTGSRLIKALEEDLT